MKRFFKAMMVLSLAVVVVSACSKKTTVAPEPEEPEEEVPPVTPQRNVLAWVDFRSNVFGTYGRLNDTANIKTVLDTMKQVGVTGIVLDVKGSSGYTAYPSQYTKQVTSVDGKTITPNVDYVGFFIAQAKKRNLKVYTSIVTFVEGEGARSQGTVFDDPAFRDKYESIVCNMQGQRVKVTSTGRNAFVNPAHPDIQNRVLNIVKEIVGKYDIDGMILDYGRYTDIDADFSDFSKAGFIDFLKNKFNDAEAQYMNFPTDIVTTWTMSDSRVVPQSTGKYFNKWLYYRASVIHDFMKKAREAVKSVKPNCGFGVYVGAWYTSYYQVGVNWASNQYDPFNDQAVRFSWAYPGYGETGYAEQLDYLLTGNYFTQLMLADNAATAGLKYHWWSVEGSINGTEYITKNKVPLYGSIDMGNVDWGSAEDISKTIRYILSRTSGGVMLFDVVHAYAPQYNRLKQPLWNAIKNGTSN